MHGVATMESGRLVVASGLDFGNGLHIQFLTEYSPGLLSFGRSDQGAAYQAPST